MATFQAVFLKGALHVRQDNTTNIKIRIIHHRKVEYISTDLYVNPKKFEKGQAKGENSLFINDRIRDELSKYQRRYLQLGSLAEKLNSKELKIRIMQDSYSEDIDFIKFSEDYLAELKQQGKEGSVRGFRGLITHFKKFSPKTNFSDIDLAFLQEFQAYLIKEGVKNGVNNYMRYFRLLFNRGKDKFNDEDRGLIRIPQNPFRKVKIEKPEQKTLTNRLSVDQLMVFINYKPERERMQMAKDMFLIMFYLIGINTKDLYNLAKPDKNGRINFNRSKTKRKYSIKLEPEAIEIINHYKGATKLLNVSERYGYYLDWQKYMNAELKKMGKEITKKLKENDPKATFPEEISTNWARHTWATIARNDCRINKDDVALCLGHEDQDNKVTDIYINYDYRIIDESNRKVLDTVFGIKKVEPEKKPGRKKKTETS